MFSTFTAGKSVKMLMDRQATAQVATKAFLFIVNSQPYTRGQAEANTKQIV